MELKDNFISHFCPIRVDRKFNRSLYFLFTFVRLQFIALVDFLCSSSSLVTERFNLNYLNYLNLHFAVNFFDLKNTFAACVK